MVILCSLESSSIIEEIVFGSGTSQIKDSRVSSPNDTVPEHHLIPGLCVCGGEVSC